jgi:hypothetical protein
MRLGGLYFLAFPAGENGASRQFPLSMDAAMLHPRGGPEKDVLAEHRRD